MVNLSSVLEELQRKGTEQHRKIYVKHGIPESQVYGVSVADLKVIFKSIKGNQALAEELYATNNMDAMYLAGMVADGSKMSTELLNNWVESAANMPMIAEYTVPWVTVENPGGRELALRWMEAEEELVKCAGWCTYSGLLATKPDEQLDLPEIEILLQRIVSEIDKAPNRTKKTMNGFVICVGYYVAPLHEQALAAAQALGKVSVDMGDTACKVPLATADIKKAEDMGRVGKKRKTIRC